MNYTLEIQKHLLKADNTDEINDKIQFVKQAINLADAHNDIEWSFDLRLDLMHYEGFSNNTIESFPAFTWILNACDTHPELFDEKDILDRYDWMLHKSFDSLSISREQIEAIIEDYGNRLVRCGMSRHNYYEALIGWSLFRGDVSDARRYLNLRDAEPLNSSSNSADLITQMCVELLDGNIDKGIVLAHEASAKLPDEKGPVYCMLIYYLNKANDQRAAQYFEEVETLLMDVIHRSFMLFDISQVMYYLARNNEEKAWEYFEKFSVWEVGTSDYIMFDYGLAILPMFRSGGKRSISLSSRMPYYRADNMYDLNELYTYYYTRVCDLANRFDARNGNSYFNEQIKFML